MTMNETTDDRTNSLSDDERQLAVRLSTLMLEGLVEAFDPETGETDDELATEIRSKLEHTKPRLVRIGLNLADCLRFTEAGLVYDAAILALHAQLRGGPVSSDEEPAIEEPETMMVTVPHIPVDPELREWDLLTAEDKIDIAEWVEALRADADRRLVLHDELQSLIHYGGGNYAGWFKSRLTDNGQKCFYHYKQYQVRTKIGIQEALLEEMRPLHEQRLCEAEELRKARKAEEEAARLRRQEEQATQPAPETAPKPAPSRPKRQRLSAKEARKRSKR